MDLATHYSTSDRLAKLPQKSQIVLKKQPNIVDAVFEHGDPLDAHAEGEARNLFRIVADKLENGRVDHTGAENFQPTAGFTNAAGLSISERAAAAANDALNIDLSTRLGKRKKARPKSAPRHHD